MAKQHLLEEHGFEVLVFAATPLDWAALCGAGRTFTLFYDCLPPPAVIKRP